MSFPKYPVYKDSDVEWLGEIPAHWAVHRARNLGRFSASGIDKKTVEGEKRVKMFNYLDVYRSQGAPLGDSEALMETTAPQSKVREHSVRRGDILLTPSSETADDVGHAAVVSCTRHSTVYSYHLMRFRPSAQCDSYYLCHWLNSKEARAYFSSVATGTTRMVLSRKDFKDTPIPLPELEEQITIATFLDQVIGKIDALIDEQKRLIELLKEKRQAMISHAVTKGLDPDVQMKGSGVEWLGEVPAHWEIRKLSSVTDKITNGYVGPTRGLFVDQGIPYLQSLHIKDNQIKFTPEYFVTKEWSDSHSKSILRPGDVLIVQTGDIGQIAVVPDGFPEANCHALIIASTIRSILAGEWLAWLLYSDYGRYSLLSIKTGALHPHLNCGYVKDIYIPVPPLEEQTIIVDWIADRQAVFINLISEAKSMVGFLKERRSALISAAVTGKIDVRGWQPPPGSSLPTETRATEPA